jgi:hypothetical protein
MRQFLRRLEEIFAAVAFADAGEHEQAAQFSAGSMFRSPAAAPLAPEGDS